MSKSITMEYGQDGRRIKATVIAGVTARGTHMRAVHLRSNWDVNMTLLVDGCDHTVPKDLLLTVLGRRGIKDFVALLEWTARVLRDELSEERMKAEAQDWSTPQMDQPQLRLVNTESSETQ